MKGFRKYSSLTKIFLCIVFAAIILAIIHTFTEKPIKESLDKAYGWSAKRGEQTLTFLHKGKPVVTIDKDTGLNLNQYVKRNDFKSHTSTTHIHTVPGSGPRGPPGLRGPTGQRGSQGQRGQVGSMGDKPQTQCKEGHRRDSRTAGLTGYTNHYRNKWPTYVSSKSQCWNICKNDPTCPQADYYGSGGGGRCYVYTNKRGGGGGTATGTWRPGGTFLRCQRPWNIK